MKNQQNRPGNQKGDQEKQGTGRTGDQNRMQSESNQQNIRGNEQRSGNQRREEGTEREGQENREESEQTQNRDITSQANTDVRNTDRGRLPGEQSEREGEDMNMENLEDEDDVKGR